MAALTVLAVTAQAQTFNHTTNSDGSLTITGVSGVVPAITIPSTILVNGVNRSVTSIGANAFMNQSGITRITIPEGVTSIGASAFLNCEGLNEIFLPESLTSIGNNAFQQCIKLAVVTLPAGVTNIGTGAFSGCTILRSITILGNVTTIANKTFFACNGLTSVSLPASVTSIGNNAFDSCINLTSITIPSGVTSIGNYSFEWCTNLASVTLPAGITSIGDHAFYECASLTSINFPGSLTSIASTAFLNCPVASPPTISTQPANTTVLAGTSATFTISATSTLPPTYQWQVSSDGGATWGILNDNSTYAGSATATLTIDNATVDLSGYDYQAIVTNSAGTATTASAGLTVTSPSPPAITSQPTSTSVVIGANAAFSLSATGTPAPTFQWEVSMDGGNAWGYIGDNITYSGSQTATLTITNAPANFSGYQYRVLLANSGGTTTSNGAGLTVTAPPILSAISSQPASATVTSGANATFSVVASGTPAPTYQWQVSTNGGTTWNNVSGSVYSGATTSTLTITNATTSLSGFMYRVVLTNSAGITNSTSGGLTVATPSSAPVISTQPVSTTAAVGASTTFSVAGSGLPAPTYQWQISTNGGTSWSNLSNGNPYSGTKTSTLTISSVFSAMSDYQYRAVLTNSQGTATSASAGMTIPLSAPTITSQPGNTSLPVSRNAIIMVIANGNPAPTYQWQVSTDGGATWNNVSDNSVYSGSGTATLTAHSVTYSMSGYQYQAIVTNSQGTVTTMSDTLTVVSPLLTSGSFQYNANIDSSAVTIVAYTGAGGAVTIPDTLPVNGVDVPVTSIGSAFANNHAITSVIIPNGITSIGASAFRDCENITSVAIGSGVTSIGFEAFFTCYRLGSITVDPANTAYMSDATGVLFDKSQTTLIQYPIGNPGTSYVIPNGVTTIAAEAFMLADYLTSITLPDGVTTIQGEAFLKCINLVSINIPASVNSIGFEAFLGCGLTSPTIISSPARAAVVTGVNATFTVAASGVSLSYQWQVSTDGGHTWNNVSGSVYSGATTSTLTVINATMSLLGYQYRAVLTNAIGTTTTAPAVLLIGSSATKLAWLQNNFSAAQLGNPALVGDMAKPAGDGITNIVKYAFNLNPLVNDQASLPQPTIVDGNLVLTFTALRADITYTVEASPDMVTWSANGVTVQANGNQVTASYPLPANGAAYMHVVVSPGP